MVTNTQYLPQTDFTFITVDEAKKQLRLDASFDDEDSVLQQAIAAAINAAENYMGRTIAAETLQISLDAYQQSVPFTEDWRLVSVGGVVARTSADDDPVTLPADTYAQYKVPGAGCYKVSFKTPFEVVPANDAIVVNITLAIPAVVKQACLLVLADFYEIREDRNQGENRAFHNLLRPYRKF